MGLLGPYAAQLLTASFRLVGLPAIRLVPLRFRAALPVYYPALFGCKLPNHAMTLTQGSASAADAGLELPLPGAAT